MLQLFVWSIIYQPCDMSSFIVYICKELCYAVKLSRFACERTIERHFKTTTFLCLIGFCCFQRCVDHILTFSWGSVQITISQWSFSIKYVFYRWSSMCSFFAQKCRVSAIAFRLITDDLRQISQSFFGHREQCCLCMVISRGWPIFTRHVVEIEAEK